MIDVNLYANGSMGHPGSPRRDVIRRVRTLQVLIMVRHSLAPTLYQMLCCAFNNQLLLLMNLGTKSKASY